MKQIPNSIQIDDQDSQEFVISHKSEDGMDNIEIEEDQPDPNEAAEEGSVDEALMDPNALDSESEEIDQSEEVKHEEKPNLHADMSIDEFKTQFSDDVFSYQ